MLKDYLAVDIETTGLNPKTDRIIEIGAVRVRNGEIAGSRDWLINPRCSLPEFVVNLTGITEAMLADAPVIDSVISEFVDFCGDDVLLGHHIITDYSFLKRNAVNRKIPFEKMGIDTLKPSRVIFADMEKKTLSFLCERLGIASERNHRAADDALAAVRLYNLLAEKASGNEEWEKLLNPVQLVYTVKKEGPITAAQKRQLTGLLEHYGISAGCDIDSLTRNEASRRIDNIISLYGRIG